MQNLQLYLAINLNFLDLLFLVLAMRITATTLKRKTASKFNKGGCNNSNFFMFSSKVKLINCNIYVKIFVGVGN